MPVSETVAKQQIERFAEFPQFPATEAGIRELITALIAVSEDEKQCKKIGDRLMATLHFCPKPADIFEVHLALLKVATDYWQREEPSCAACGDTGWKSVIGVTGDSWVRRCDCALGRRRAGKAAGGAS